MLIVHRTVRVRLNEAGLSRLIRIFGQIMHEVDIVFITVFHGIPHLEEGNRKAPHRVAFDADTGVLPGAVRMCHVEIFIREIVSAGKTDLSINDRNLSVVSVIQKNIPTFPSMTVIFLWSLLFRKTLSPGMNGLKTRH